MSDIEYINGNIFDTHAHVLVNPVNCVGVMGKGLAKQFKLRFPENFKYYKKMCDLNVQRYGGLTFFEEDGYKIINASTKNHWRDPSEYNVITAICGEIAEYSTNHKLNYVAMPFLGCGLGGLDISLVKDIYEKYLIPMTDSDTKYLVYDF